MAEEGKGVAMAILGIVAVIAVVGLVLLFSGATGKVSAPYQKVYVDSGQYPYFYDRTAGGFFNTAGNPDAVTYPEGALGSEAGQMIARQDDVENPAFAFRYTTERSPRNTPAYNVDPCTECTGRYERCIIDPSEFAALKQTGRIRGNYPCAEFTGTGV